MATKKPTGEDVKAAQRILDIPVDGKAGPVTTAALAAYQLAAGLPPTGQLNAATTKALHR